MKNIREYISCKKWRTEESKEDRGEGTTPSTTPPPKEETP